MSDTQVVDAAENVSDAHVPGGVPPVAADNTTESAPVTTTDGEQPPADGGEGEKPRAPASVQKSINRLTRQRAEAERRALRAEAQLEAMQSMRTQPQQAAADRASGIKESDFANYADYSRAIAREAAREELKAEREVQANRAAGEAARAGKTAFEKEATEQAKAAGIDFEDAWETLLALPREDVSEDFAGFIYAAEAKALLVDHFAKNPDEVARYSAMPPYRLGLEMARLETRLSTKAAPRTTNAPPPGPTVGGRSVATFNPEKANMDEYAAYWKKREARS